MKKTIAFLLLFSLSQGIFAKKIKFAVDLSSQIVSVNGVHLTGDFQTAIGLGPDWDPGMISMTKEGSTSIYSVILDLPAFKKYEYRFVNGTESYEVEFVPDESRVGYDMVDNRWIYLDSIANDTTFVGAIIFGGNAPAGKKLVRYKVDLRLAGAVASTGVHLTTSYQPSLDPKQITLYSFGEGAYEVISYVVPGNYTYLYYNGNTTANSESVTGTCAPAGQRTIAVTGDVQLETVCFSSCLACKNVGISERDISSPTPLLFPNPASETVRIIFEAGEQYEIKVRDLQGKLMTEARSDSPDFQLNTSSFSSGVYRVETKGKNEIKQTKLVIAR